MTEKEVTALLVGETSDEKETTEQVNCKSLLYRYLYSTSILVVPLTFCWYFASSKNAIATQQLVETYDFTVQDSSIAMPIMAVLTSLQILLGLFISFPLYLFSKAKVDYRDDIVKDAWT